MERTHDEKTLERIWWANGAFEVQMDAQQRRFLHEQLEDPGSVRRPVL